MFKMLVVSVAVSAFCVMTPVLAEDLNQPQDHRSTINQQQSNQVGQPIDNRIDSEIRLNQSATPITPSTTLSLPRSFAPRSSMTPEPPPPPSRRNSQPRQSIEPSASDPRTPLNTAPVVPDTTYPETTKPNR